MTKSRHKLNLAKDKAAARDAIEKAGRVALCRYYKISHHSVSAWFNRGIIPIERLDGVCSLSGLSVEKVAPSLTAIILRNYHGR